MFDGSVATLKTYNYSTTNIYGGTISNYLLADGYESLTVNIYGYDFNYDPLAGDYAGGQLTGFWGNDTPFSIDLWYSSGPGAPVTNTWPHVVLHEIPEPTSILLVGLGTLLLRKQNQS